MTVDVHPPSIEYRTRLSFEIHGTHGPLVLMLHGLGSRGEDWVLQIEALQNEYRMVTCDLRGHGSSPSPAGWPRGISQSRIRPMMWSMRTPPDQASAARKVARKGAKPVATRARGEKPVRPQS